MRLNADEFCQIGWCSYVMITIIRFIYLLSNQRGVFSVSLTERGSSCHLNSCWREPLITLLPPFQALRNLREVICSYFSDSFLWLLQGWEQHWDPRFWRNLMLFSPSLKQLCCYMHALFCRDLHGLGPAFHVGQRCSCPWWQSCAG